MTLREEIESLLSEKESEMHVTDIAKTLIKREIVKDIDESLLEGRISSLLSNDIRKKKNKSNYRRISNGKGGYKRGVYRLKRVSSPQENKALKSLQKTNNITIPKVKTTYLGKAGEFAVLSELLFEGFNANIMSVDEGIDIVASKNNKFFYIQVKTTQIKSPRVNIPGIKFDRFTQFADFEAYYIFVLRHYEGKSRRHEYFIFRSSEIEKLIDTGFINKENSNINLTIKIEGDKVFLIKSKAKEEITYNLNNFSVIK